MGQIRTTTRFFNRTLPKKSQHKEKSIQLKKELRDLGYVVLQDKPPQEPLNFVEINIRPAYEVLEDRVGDSTPITYGLPQKYQDKY